MRYFQSFLLIASIFLFATTAVQAQVDFVPQGSGANVPFEASLYKGDGITIDKTIKYGEGGRGLTVPAEYNSAASNFNVLVGTGDDVTVSYWVIDGTDASRLADPRYGANVSLTFRSSGTSSTYGVNTFEIEFIMPQTVSGTIGYIAGFELVSARGYANNSDYNSRINGTDMLALYDAFNYAFDGVGGMTLSPNGSFTQDSSAFPFLELKGNFIVLPTFSGWKIENGLSAGDAADDADTDGDGIGQLQEFAFAGDPHVNDISILPTFDLTEDGGSVHLELKVTRPVGIQGIDYTPNTTADLASWPAGSTGIVNADPTPVDNLDGTETLTYRRSSAVSSADEAFIRVDVSEAP